MNSKKIKLALPLLFLSIILLSCDEDPVVENFKYPKAEEQKINSDALENAVAQLSSNEDVNCLIIERNNVVVLDEFFQYRQSTDTYDVRSVTKSIISILIGIAIDRGEIDDVQDPISKYLSSAIENLDSAKGAITIEQLLTMSSGLPWKELNSAEQDYGTWVTSPDQLMWIINRPFEFIPGTVWNYNTGASHILSAVLTEAAGLSASDYAQKYLFDKIESEVGYWPVCSRGYNFGGHGIKVHGMDMIKIGRMMMNGGVYNGVRIVSSDWIAQSMSQHFATNIAIKYDTGYGYLWWRGFDSNTNTEFYWAIGYGGQFIINVPKWNLVIAATTRFTVSNRAGPNWVFVIDTIIQQIFPAIRS